MVLIYCISESVYWSEKNTGQRWPCYRQSSGLCGVPSIENLLSTSVLRWHPARGWGSNSRGPVTSWRSRYCSKTGDNHVWYLERLLLFSNAQSWQWSFDSSLFLDCYYESWSSCLSIFITCNLETLLSRVNTFCRVCVARESRLRSHKARRRRR